MIAAKTPASTESRSLCRAQIGPAEVICAIGAIVLTLLIAPFYTAGDQTYYSAFYDALPDESFESIFLLAGSYLGSIEPIYPIFAWVASPFISKLFFISIFNASLAFYSSLLLRTMGAKAGICLAVILTNFYFYTLFFSAERLKLGFLFFIVGLYYWNNKRRAIFAMALAPLTHVQIAIPLAGIMLSKLFRHRLRKPTFKDVVVGGVVLLLLAGATFFLLPQILSKFQTYLGQETDALGPIKMLVMYLLAMRYSQDKVATTSIFAPLFIMGLLVGSERINMFVYFLFLANAVTYRRGINLGMLIVNGYFAWKSIDLVAKILHYGDGFPVYS